MPQRKFEIMKYVLGAAFLVFSFSVGIAGQQNGAGGTSKIAAPAAPAKPPVVTQLDIAGLRKALTPGSKPLLVNFWATWCDPCREEFPDLVKLDAEYKGRIDFITISLDELSEINRDVPKFLVDMKAEMPAYLLKTLDDDAAIAMISKSFTGALPFTILYDPSGKAAYSRQGKIKTETVRAEIDKLLTGEKAKDAVAVMDFVKIKHGRRDETLFYYENNWKLYRDIAVKKGIIGSYELVDAGAEAAAAFDLILITRYKDEDQWKSSEKSFEAIIKEARPNGPLLKNELKPEDFRQNVFARTVRPVFTSNR